MHVHYAALLVASSVAIIASAESAKDISTNHLPLEPPRHTFDREDSPTSDLDAQLPPDATDEEKAMRNTSKRGASAFYAAVHGDVALSPQNVVHPLKRNLWRLYQNPDDLYVELGLDQIIDDKLLDNKIWKNWAVFVAKKNKKVDPAVSVARAMMHQMNDKRFLTILEKGINRPSTFRIAEPLKAAKQQQWLHDHYKPVEVFTRLGLTESAQNLFDSALYPTWSDFVQAYKAEHPADDTSELGWLEKVFKTDTNLLAVLTSASNMNSQKGKMVLNLYMREQSDSARYFDALMHAPRGLRAYFTKNKLQDVTQQEKLMELTNPERTIDYKSLHDLHVFMMANAIDIPKSENVLRVVLDEDDPILSIWVTYMLSYTVRMPVTDPVIKTFEVLTSTDTAAEKSESIVRSFVSHWVENAVNPNKVYKMLLSGKGQDAKGLQNVWKLFIHEYRKKNEVHLQPTSEITPLEEDEAAILANNELEIPEMINQFMKLSAKVSRKSWYDRSEKQRRKIVWDWVEKESQPEQVLKMLLLDADATRLLDHWVSCIGEYLKTISIANLNKAISRPDTTPTYSKMLIMLSTVRDLGHLPSRTILSQQELKWMDANISPNNVFTLLQLDKGSNELLEEAHKLLAAKVEAADELAEKARVSLAAKAGYFRPVETSSKPAAKVGPSLLDEDVAALIDKALSELLNNPSLAVYLEFQQMYNDKHKTNKTLLKTLLATFGEKKVAKLLNAAKEQSKPVQDLQTELFEHYVKTGKSTGDVVELLGLSHYDPTGARLWEAYAPIYIKDRKAKSDYAWED